MAEKKKYNSILVSGRKDETLTYSRYVKDEESGESVKESLDKKVNTTDKLESQQIKDGAITNEKLAADSVGNTNLQDGSVSNEKLEDGSVTNEKLAENSITKDKLQDKTIGVEKLDNELRQAIAAATGLPENLVETIQNVDDTLKNHQRQLDDKQSQIDDKQQQITANDEDISLLQTRSTQMEETIKSIAATGGASQATAVTYNNEKSKLVAVNIQSAVDEVVDKTAIKDEEGALVETPFHYIQNEEFIFAKVDAEDKLLFGIHWDGTPEFGKTSAVEDRLQSQVNLLADKITTILGDNDMTSAIDTLKELKDFFANIDNTQTLTSILTNLNSVSTKLGEDIKKLQDTKVDKEEGKSLIEDEVKECFRVIENEEFIMAIVDAEDKVLFGFYRATGKPYYPLNEMYHVIQNEEYFAAWVTTDDKVVLGLRRDGQIIGEIHAVNSLKQVISQLQSELVSLQEKVGTIDTNLKELLDVFSLQDNEEYLAVEQDAEGKILSTTNRDGSHYIHNAKSETIPEEFSHIEDPEGRMEIKTDSDNKVMSYRDSQGKKHEHDMDIANLDVSNLNLKGNSVNNIQDALKANGFDVKTPIDWSDYISNDGKNPLYIPEPRCARINISGIDSMPISKYANNKAYFEMWDMQGNYFKKRVIINAQGNTTMQYPKKSFACDFFDNDWDGDAFAMKIGDWVAQDSFHFKAQYLDFFKGVSIVAYKIVQEVWASRSPIYSNPWKKALLANQSITSGSFENQGIDDLSLQKDTGAKCVPDAFPCVVYLNGEFYGLFNWALKKHRDNYHMNKSSGLHIHIDGGNYPFLIPLDWTKFEVRNPKGLLTNVPKGSGFEKYDGDFPKELLGKDTDGYDTSNKTHILSNQVKEAVVEFNTLGRTLNAMGKEEGDKYLAEHYDLNNLIDCYVMQYVFADEDEENNWQWVTYDGKRWYVCEYDKDRTFGQTYHCRGVRPANSKLNAININTENYPFKFLYTYHKEEIKARYEELKALGIFTPEHFISLLKDWVDRFSSADFKLEYKKWSESPSNRNDLVDREHWKVIDYSYATTNSYDNNKTYKVGETCFYGKLLYTKFECIKESTGNPPQTGFYNEKPYDMGYHDSIWRAIKFIIERFEYVDVNIKNLV